MDRPRVLLADDNPQVLRSVGRLIEHEFDLVATAHDGDAALSATVHHEPDLAILDISMPAFTGIEVTTRLRQRQHPVRILLFTLHDDCDLMDAARKAGAQGYVLKQRAETDLLAAMRWVLSGGTFWLNPSCRRPISD